MRPLAWLRAWPGVLGLRRGALIAAATTPGLVAPGLVATLAAGALLVGSAAPRALAIGAGQELARLTGLILVVWLASAALALRRPAVADLLALARTGLMAGPLALLLAYPAEARHGAAGAVAVTGSLQLLIWGWRVVIVSRTAALRLDLGPGQHLGGLWIPASVAGGVLLFRHHTAGIALFGPLPPLPGAHRAWAYMAGIGLTLVLPILVAMGLAVYIMLREDPADPPTTDGSDRA